MGVKSCARTRVKCVSSVITDRVGVVDAPNSESVRINRVIYGALVLFWRSRERRKHF